MKTKQLRITVHVDVELIAGIMKHTGRSEAWAIRELKRIILNNDPDWHTVGVTYKGQLCSIHRDDLDEGHLKEMKVTANFDRAHAGEPYYRWIHEGYLIYE